MLLVPVLAHGRRDHRIHEPVKREPVARINGPVRRSLRHLMPQSLHRELHVSHAQIGVLFPRIQLQGPVGVRTRHRPKPAHVSDVKLLRLPGFQSLSNLLGKPLGIGGRAERLFGQNARCLMMPVSIALAAGKARHEHIRAECPNHTHHVGERRIVSTPLLKRLFWILRKSKIRDM